MKVFVSVLMLLLVTALAGQVVAAPAVIQPVSIVVTPNDITVPAGSSVQFKAIGYDGEGNPVKVKTFTWSVDSANAGTISKTGKFTAKGALVGCNVRAAVGEVSDTSSLTIVPGAIKTLTISPSPASVYVGSKTQFSVTAEDSFGNGIDTANAVWSLKPGTGLTIDANKQVTAGNIVGTFGSAIKVTLNRKVANANVTVSPLPPHEIVITRPASSTISCGEKAEFAAEARDEDGNKLEGHSFIWSCASVCGKLSSTKGATTTLTASKKPAAGMISVKCALPGSPVAQMALNVVPGAPKTITITAPKSALSKDQTFQYTAKVADQFGNVLVDAPVSWELTNDDAGSIDPDTGLFTAGAVPGTYKNVVVATVDGTQISKSANVIVSPPTGFNIRQNEVGESYTYDLSGTGTYLGYEFSISGDMTMEFVNSLSSDYFDNPVDEIEYNINLTMHFGDDYKVNQSGSAVQYYTRSEDGDIRLHGSYVDISGNSGTAWISDSPGYQVYLPSPMRVGMSGKWDADLDTGYSLNGSYSVKSSETITVPAGTYLTLKTALTPGILGGTISQNTWYAPELLGQAMVKILGTASMSVQGSMLKMTLDFSLNDENRSIRSAQATEETSEAQSELSPLMKAVMDCALGLSH